MIGAGKASAQMARAVERLLGARITGGEINVKDGHGAALRRIKINECGHPMPDQRGVAGARRIAKIASQAGPDDLIICLISGGASALLAASRAAHHARRKTKDHSIVAALRRQHSRDQLRAETHLADQRRPTRAPGVSGDAAHADSLRRHRRRSGRDRLRAHGSRSLHVRRCARDLRRNTASRTSCDRHPQPKKRPSRATKSSRRRTM